MQWRFSFRAFCSFFSISPADLVEPSRVTITPVVEFTPTAVVSIFPDPSITCVPGTFCCKAWIECKIHKKRHHSRKYINNKNNRSVIQYPRTAWGPRRHPSGCGPTRRGRATRPPPGRCSRWPRRRRAASRHVSPSKCRRPPSRWQRFAAFRRRGSL